MNCIRHLRNTFQTNPTHPNDAGHTTYRSQGLVSQAIQLEDQQHIEIRICPYQFHSSQTLQMYIYSAQPVHFFHVPDFSLVIVIAHQDHDLNTCSIDSSSLTTLA